MTGVPCQGLSLSGVPSPGLPLYSVPSHCPAYPLQASHGPDRCAVAVHAGDGRAGFGVRSARRSRDGSARCDDLPPPAAGVDRRLQPRIVRRAARSLLSCCSSLSAHSSSLLLSLSLSFFDLSFSPISVSGSPLSLSVACLPVCLSVCLSTTACLCSVSFSLSLPKRCRSAPNDSQRGRAFDIPHGFASPNRFFWVAGTHARPSRPTPRRCFLRCAAGAGSSC